MLIVNEVSLSEYVDGEGRPLLVVLGKEIDSGQRGVWLGRAKNCLYELNRFSDDETTFFISENANVYNYLIDGDQHGIKAKEVKEVKKLLQEKECESRNGEKEMSEKKEVVFLRMSEKFVKRAIKTKDGSTFNVATLPKGTDIHGIDVGNYTFNPKFIDNDKFVKGTVVIPLLKDSEVWLKKVQRDNEGNALVGSDGKKMQDVIKVRPEQLKDALQIGYQNYKKEHQVESEKEEKEEGVDNDIEAEKNEQVNDFIENRYKAAAKKLSIEPENSQGKEEPSEELER